MECSFLSDVGVIRTNNEDFLLVDEKLSLFIIADGMGGHNAGEVASKEACNFIQNYIAEHYIKDKEEEFYRKLIEHSIYGANDYVYSIAKKNKETFGMGCTVVVLLIVRGKYFIQHIGDSRAYLIRNGELEKLTVDHTLVQRLINDGALTEREGLNHEYRHIITQSLGGELKLSVDSTVMKQEENDILILSTDGLHDYVDKEYIVNTVLTNNLDDAVRQLVDKANQNGGKDNCSVILIKL